jgi:hypothetical protein
MVIAMPALASYRVYELKLVHYNADGKVERVEMVLSNLDPFQYEHIYGFYRWTKVVMHDTWYCPGDTSNLRAYCKKPKVKNDRYPASMDHPKRTELPFNYQPVIP